MDKVFKVIYARDAFSLETQLNCLVYHGKEIYQVLSNPSDMPPYTIIYIDLKSNTLWADKFPDKEENDDE